MGHLLDVAVGRIIEHEDLRHLPISAWAERTRRTPQRGGT
jgi:hypothetical protein